MVGRFFLIFCIPIRFPSILTGVNQKGLQNPERKEKTEMKNSEQRSHEPQRSSQNQKNTQHRNESGAKSQKENTPSEE